jgi:hypothetical protein
LSISHAIQRIFARPAALDASRKKRIPRAEKNRLLPIMPMSQFEFRHFIYPLSPVNRTIRERAFACAD